MKRTLLASLLLSFAVLFGYSSTARADEVVVVRHPHHRVYVHPVVVHRYYHHRHYYRHPVVHEEVDVHVR